MTQTSTAPTDLDRARAKYRAERDKRLDPSRREVLDLTGREELVEDPFTEVVPREPLHDTVDAVVVGGGFGGLLTAAYLRKAGLGRIRIVEKAGGVGGVWYWNRYPGAMCDVESYVYLPMLEELGYIPRHRYSYGPEILAYTQKIAEHFKLYDHALFHTGVTGLEWNEGTARWKVSTDRGDAFQARFVVVAHGSFTSLKLPAIEGIDSFRGTLFHTSRWDYDYTGGSASTPLTKLADKKVGVIGTGATAVQITAPLAASAQRLLVFQRTPSTVAPRNNRETDPQWARTLEPGWQQRRRDNFTAVTNGEPITEDLVGDGWTVFYHAMLSGDGYGDLSPGQLAEQRELTDLQHMENVRARIDAVVRDPATAEALKPYYRYQCKRPCFHDEYLPAFNRPNVQLVDTRGQGVRRITERGVEVDGVEYPLDCLVLATGFDQDSAYVDRVGFDVTGRDGAVLSDKWKDGPETFQGVMTSGFPNFFILPPNYTQGTAAVNFVHTLEETVRHVASLIEEFDRRQVVADVSRESEESYVRFVVDGSGLALLGGGSFLKDCTPGRWNNEGDPEDRPRKNVNYPGTSTAYFTMLEEWRRRGSFEDLNLTPSPRPVRDGSAEEPRESAGETTTR
ncbi:NAD(P)/FAD-dependent oxidoreductase [Streptomyces sp. NBC_01239]|uniref:flavin-containing monooxygenase n=1 Tax=Streptomyces sp. NBC_01239 TaxID=2903792 RepID=UPI00224CF56C|nr:NAD(P)/FAD-dependent oxidoreductase [Streptomyces sp. NBC_01239]MCX4815227.1 NAD(P)/FAD-dependent oxidoreductase [Streptomyces sp. NBC_01239]